MQCTEQFSLINQRGLHARAAAKLIEITSQFECDILLSNQSTQSKAVDGKSILSVMMLAVACGQILSVETNGDDADAAIKAIGELIAKRFDEDA